MRSNKVDKFSFSNGFIISNSVLQSKIFFSVLILAIFTMGLGLCLGIDLILKGKIFPSLLLIFAGTSSLPIMLFRLTWNVPSAIFFSEEKIYFIYGWGKRKEYSLKDIIEMEFGKQADYYILKIKTEEHLDEIGSISQEIATKLKELKHNKT